MVYCCSKQQIVRIFYMKKICYIIGAGDVPEKLDLKAAEDDFIICADGGFRHNTLLGRMCDLVVGDFDSLGERPAFENKVVLPCEKDFTDMKVAVDEGLSRGCRSFVLYGALGGERYDHSVANISLLSYICSRGAEGEIRHAGKIFRALSDGELVLPPCLEGYISVFSLCDESEGVSIEGLKYEVKDVSLRLDTPFGVSNEFTGKEARISVKKGRLLIIYNQ
ncbi:MAG: thiamine diphosphokinase [Ruminococcaceae bacterium]|nr:thiamine diphosphokinase [Oscillospiraceae bacterium]